MRAAFCDDSMECLQTMVNLYISYCKTANIQCEYDTYQSGAELLKNWEKTYSVVFLDVSMPDINGIDVAREMRKHDSDVFIVFITSYIEYALYGYEVEAFSYLLKEQLELSFCGCMDNLFKKIQSRKSRVFFKFIEGDVSLALNELVYVESRKHKLLFYLNEKETPYSLYQKLDDVEKHIGSTSFLRVHKSFLVNMMFIERMNRYNATIQNGIMIPIPRNKYSEVSSAYLLYRG